MSSGSFKDTSKALNLFFATKPPPEALTEDLQSTLQAFLDKHERIDDSTSQRIHDELRSIYTKELAGQHNIRLGTFLQILLMLQPTIKGFTRKAEWWRLLLGPIIDGVGHKRDEISPAIGILLAFMDYDSEAEDASEQAEESRHILKILLSAHIKRTRTKDLEVENLTEVDEHIADQLESVLVAFGRRKPKDFMMALDQLITDVETRFQAMSLLCGFVRHQPPHLYTVSETPLIEHLLKCLMIDTSSTIIQIALTTLIMFLPHIPRSVVEHLPRLFLIYTRLLSWERIKEDLPHQTDDLHLVEASHRIAEPATDTSWVKLETLTSTLSPTAPNLNFYFTFLYGMYPINFMSYIRKPRKYLKSINFPRAEEFDFDQTHIKKRTDIFRKVHLMHPNFFMITQEEELEGDRWVNSDPADIVGECMALYMDADLWANRTVGETQHLQATSNIPDFIRTEDIPVEDLSEADSPPLLSARPMSPSQMAGGINPASTGSIIGAGVSQRASQRSPKVPPSSSSIAGSPGTRSVDESLSSPAPSTNIMLEGKSAKQPRRGSKSSIENSRGQTQRLLAASIGASASSRPIGLHGVCSEINNSFLRQEVMILRNDLNFERYLKQQHLSHIGELQRRQIKEATIEADTQNLIQTNKTLKAKLAKANETYASLKRETATGRQNSKRFETDLSSKVRSLRQAQRLWELREDSLLSDLQSAKSDCAYLRRLVVESEARELLGQQKLASMEIQLEQVEEHAAKIQELDRKIQTYQAKELSYWNTQSQCELLRAQLAVANFNLQSKDDVVERTILALKQNISELTTRLREAQEEVHDSKS